MKSSSYSYLEAFSELLISLSAAEIGIFFSSFYMSTRSFGLTEFAHIATSCIAGIALYLLSVKIRRTLYEYR